MTVIDIDEINETLIDIDTTDIRSPLYLIRKYRLWCCNNQPKEVRLCSVVDCPLDIYRFGHKPKGINGQPSVLKSIHLRCLDCSGYSCKEVRNCSVINCNLYPYRMGRNLNRTGICGNADALRRWKDLQKRKAHLRIFQLNKTNLVRLSK